MVFRIVLYDIPSQTHVHTEIVADQWRHAAVLGLGLEQEGRVLQAIELLHGDTELGPQLL